MPKSAIKREDSEAHFDFPEREQTRRSQSRQWKTKSTIRKGMTYLHIQRQKARSAVKGSGRSHSKDIGMGSCVKQKECQLGIILLPKQQPVRLDMTFPDACIFARKDMGTVFGGECTRIGQQTQYSLEVGDIQPAPFTEFVRLLETSGVVNRIFHASNCAIKSSTLLASYTRPASTSSNACCNPLLRGFLIVHPILRDKLRAKRTSLRGTSK